MRFLLAAETAMLWGFVSILPVAIFVLARFVRVWRSMDAAGRISLFRSTVLFLAICFICSSLLVGFAGSLAPTLLVEMITVGAAAWLFFKFLGVSGES